jgi:hypothetical protein
MVVDSSVSEAIAEESSTSNPLAHNDEYAESPFRMASKIEDLEKSEYSWLLDARTLCYADVHQRSLGRNFNCHEESASSLSRPSVWTTQFEAES